MLGVWLLVVGVWFLVLGVRECVGWNVLVFSSVFLYWWLVVFSARCKLLCVGCRPFFGDVK